MPMRDVTWVISAATTEGSWRGTAMAFLQVDLGRAAEALADIG